MKMWRCELTAFSRTCNLYFVALIDTIRVYQPAFEQELGNAALVLHPPVSKPGLSGYIDDNHPHAINRILVDYLGDKEVLLVACDDGDVIGYYISVIQSEVEARERRNIIQLEPFFHVNVEQSAWGLAIHRRARMVAVSANNYKTTLFPFELEPGPNGETLGDSRPDRSNPIEMGANTPFVTFDNFVTDPLDVRLRSGTIAGYSHFLRYDGNDRVWRRQTECLRYCALPGGVPCDLDTSFRCGHMVWGSHFIDLASCRQADCGKEAFGHSFEDRNETSVVDVTSAKLKMRKYRPGTMLSAYRNGDSIEQVTEEQSTQEPISGSEQNDADSTSGSEEANSTSDSEEEDQDFSDQYFPDDREELIRLGTLKLRADLPSPNAAESRPAVIITKEEVFLIQENYQEPLVAMLTPFYNDPKILFRHDRYEQMKYSLYVPELSIFIVASNYGRCSIFSITRYLTEGNEWRCGFRQEYLLPFNEQEDEEFWQADCRQNMLVGIAAGPVQGCFDAVPGEEDRDAERANLAIEQRWRLFMYFQDHTVCTYELASKKRDTSVGLADLVV